MRLEDMKSDIPETPDFIHKMIQNEVAKQIQDTKVMNLQRRKTWTIPKIAAVAAACTLAVSTAAYAGVNLYHWVVPDSRYRSIKISSEGSFYLFGFFLNAGNELNHTLHSCILKFRILVRNSCKART